MNHTPETRASLLARVRDPADQAAWSEFVEIYRPVILRLARHKGMQVSDAEDICQQVLLAVANAVDGYDPRRAKFRTWLHRVANNAILNGLTRGPQPGSGDSRTLGLLAQHPAADGPDSQLLQLEHRREVFRWAARCVKPEFRADTWSAFWMTTVEGMPCDEVATKLGKTLGAVYTARSRVTLRLQEKVRDYYPDIDADRI